MQLHKRFALRICIVISATAFSVLLPNASAQYPKKTSSPSSYTPPPPPPPRSEPTYTPPPRPQPTYTPPPTNNTYHPPVNNTPTNTYHPPTTNYTPTPNNTYHPPVNNTPASTNTYRPPVNNTPVAHTYTPGTNNTATTGTGTSGHSTEAYTPGSTHTYTPGEAHTYTPGGPGSSTTETSGGNIITHTANGATVYTPSAPSATSSTHTVSGTVVSPSTTTHVPATPVNLTATTATPKTLDAKSSSSTIHEINTTRATLTGINKHPLPSGTVTTHANGSLTIAAAGGKQYDVRLNGTLSSVASGREKVNFLPSGKIQSVHTPTVDVYHGPHGVHTIVQHRADKSTLVSTSRHTGYLERPFTNGGKQYVARTYYSHGDTITRVYGSYSLHGAALNYYIPAHTYAPDYYGWAYYPWNAPGSYAWGWNGQGWFANFADFYAQSQGYASPADWLADYLMGNTLADANEMQSDSDDTGQADESQYADPEAEYAQADSPITPEIKEAISQEIQQQIAYENAAAANPTQEANLADLPQALVPDHLFIVSTPLQVVTLGNLNCSLGVGNVIRLVTPPSDGTPTATLAVSASRKYDCPAGEQVTLSLDQLQEMENHYRAQIDGGLYELHHQQGQKGLPAAPYAAIQPPPVPADEQPSDNPDVETLLNNEQAVGKQTEAQANSLASNQIATTVKN